MHEFFDVGWLHEINRRIAAPLGVVLAMHLNDDPLPDGTVDDGTLVHGWHCIPIEAASIIQPTIEERLRRMAEFDAHIRDVRGSHHHR